VNVSLTYYYRNRGKLAVHRRGVGGLGAGGAGETSGGTRTERRVFALLDKLLKSAVNARGESAGKEPAKGVQ